MLVGNITGTKFEIASDGTILTPQEISFRKTKQQEEEIFRQLEQEGVLDEYLKKATTSNEGGNIRDIINSKKESFSLGVDKLNKIKNELISRRHSEYIKFIIKFLDEAKDKNTHINSSFTVIPASAEKPSQCLHILEKITPEGITILSKTIFKYTDEFRRKLLEPSIMDYAQRSPLIEEKIFQNEPTTDFVSYQAYSENNNIFSVTNISKNYVDNISKTIHQTSPIVYKQITTDNQNSTTK